MVKNLPANVGDASDVGSIPWLGRSPGVGNSNLLQYSCLENPWTEEPGGLQSMGSQESDTTQQPNNNVSSAALVTGLTTAAPLNFPDQDMTLGTRFSLSAPFNDFISMVTSLMSTVH